MSGPKCYSYRVVEDPAVVAARQEAAALAAANARIEAASQRLARLAGEVARGNSQYGDAVATLEIRVVRSHQTSASAANEAQTLEASLREAEERFRRELGSARKAAFAEQLAGDAMAGEADERMADVIAAARARNEPAATESAHDLREKHLADCSRIYERLRDDVPVEALERVELAFKSAIEAATKEIGPTLRDALRTAVAEGNAAAKERDQRIEGIETLERELDDSNELSPTEVLRLRELLAEERSGSRGVVSLRTEIEACRLAAAHRRETELKERERATVSAALENAFKELGYQVQQGFETALADDGAAYVRRSGWNDHAVRVRLDAMTDQVQFNVVRDDRPQLMSSESVRREEEFCEDREALEQALSSRGVGLGAEWLTPPGVVEVPAVSLDDAKLPAPKRAGQADRTRARTR